MATTASDIRTSCPECCSSWPAPPARPRSKGCGACRREYHRRWRADHPQAERKRNARHYSINAERLRSEALDRYHVEGRRFKKYGITREEFEAMLVQQEHECAVCLREIDDKAHIDHDHKSGEVRGLLCSSCNRALGYLGDDPQILERALDYLTRKERA